MRTINLKYTKINGYVLRIKKKWRLQVVTG